MRCASHDCRSNARHASGLALAGRNVMCTAISPGNAAGAGGLGVTIPNLITIGRLCLVPLIVWLILAPHPLGAFLVFVVAGASDAVDGFLARQLNLRSDLGAYLDPLA